MPNKIPNIMECPECGIPMQFWENFSVSIKGYMFPNKEKVDGKPFYVCRTCGYFMFVGNQIFTFNKGEWIPVKTLFVFR